MDGGKKGVWGEGGGGGHLRAGWAPPSFLPPFPPSLSPMDDDLFQNQL